MKYRIQVVVSALLIGIGCLLVGLQTAFNQACHRCDFGYCTMFQIVDNDVALGGYLKNRGRPDVYERMKTFRPSRTADYGYSENLPLGVVGLIITVIGALGTMDIVRRKTACMQNHT
ncbi:MAG: hypothetical protein ACLPT4_02245 [Verrucomicrobiia bacterium]